MRIVDINPFFYPLKGGIEHRMYDTCKMLSDKGHDVTVLTGRLPGTEEEEDLDGIRIVRLKSRFIDIYNPPYIERGYRELQLPMGAVIQRAAVQIRWKKGIHVSQHVGRRDRSAG
jgi:glycosyltransferase involved in cell wall biosynthesis